MLSIAGRQQALRLLPSAAAAGAAWMQQQQRGMKLFEIFSKEEREKRKAKLKEEMQRGYFDDFRDFRDSKGKVWLAPEKLVPAGSAPAFPSMQVLQSDGKPTTFPPAAAGASSSAEPGSSGSQAEQQPAAASLVCLAFRAGAQPMLEAWAGPWSAHFVGRAGVALYELAIVEGVVMKLWPFRQLLLRSGAKSGAQYALPCRNLHHFGDMEALRQSLHLTNLLTGYVFLVDSAGRLRWRGSGSPSETELSTLLRCTDELLQQEAKQQQQQQRRRQQQQPQQQGQPQEQGQQ